MIENWIVMIGSRDSLLPVELQSQLVLLVLLLLLLPVSLVC